jgi:hypothetical protein
MHFIGLDVHSATFTMAVVNGKGKLCWNISRATSEKNLIEAVSKVEGPRQVVVEESHMAQWVKMTIEAYVDTLVVCDPRRNRWIAEADFSDDRTSAIKLAQLLRGGYIARRSTMGHSPAMRKAPLLKVRRSEERWLSATRVAWSLGLYLRGIKTWLDLPISLSPTIR